MRSLAHAYAVDKKQVRGVVHAVLLGAGQAHFFLCARIRSLAHAYAVDEKRVRGVVHALLLGAGQALKRALILH